MVSEEATGFRGASKGRRVTSAARSETDDVLLLTTGLDEHSGVGKSSAPIVCGAKARSVVAIEIVSPAPGPGRGRTGGGGALKRSCGRKDEQQQEMNVIRHRVCG